MFRNRPLLRILSVAIACSLGGAWLYSGLFGQPFKDNLVYAVCIVILTQMMIAAGRYGLTYWLRQNSPENPDNLERWPAWRLMAPWVVVSAVVGYFAGTGIGDMITRPHVTLAASERMTHMLLLGVIIAITIAVGITYLIYVQGRMASMEFQTQKAIRLAAENQLKLLESQLEPHMLFNTLANLRALIGRDPTRAQGMLDHLIAYLRATLEASRTGAHPLASEFERIEDYLELMQIRMGARLHIHLDLPGELAGLPVPPLLLQPLVENSIKHGLEPKVKGGRIEVSASRRDGLLLLNVRDTGAGLSPLARPGSNFGLQHIRERLQTLYGDVGRLDLVPATDADGGTLATVTIPLIQYRPHENHRSDR
jgi:hypothetical protein